MVSRSAPLRSNTPHETALKQPWFAAVATLTSNINHASLRPLSWDAVKERDFVIMAVVAGVPSHMVMIRHIFPNVVNTVLIVVSLLVGQTILLEASLSFLGVGVPPGEPAWGIMVAEGRNNLINVWWLSLLPGLAITSVVIAMNLFGDWLRDTLDPKLRRT